MNSASFYKRILSYIVDISLVSIMVTLMYTGFNKVFDFNTTYTKILATETTQLAKDYKDKKINSKEYTTKLEEVSNKHFYKVTLETVPYYLVVIAITILYGGLLCFYFKGKTIGKKMFNIRIVNALDSSPVSLNSLIIRSIISYNLYTSIVMVILVFITKNTLYDVNMTLTMITMSLTTISGIMILFNKEKRAVHDYMFNTKVISEI